MTRMVLLLRKFQHVQQSDQPAAVVPGVGGTQGGLHGPPIHRALRLELVNQLPQRLLLETKTGGRDWVAAAFIYVSPLAPGPVVAQAMRRRQSWKGRTYR